MCKDPKNRMTRYTDKVYTKQTQKHVKHKDIGKSALSGTTIDHTWSYIL